VSTLDSAPPIEGRPALPGEELTRRAITVITAVIFSFRVSHGCDLPVLVEDGVVDEWAAA
jgi:hypothetical protein